MGDGREVEPAAAAAAVDWWYVMYVDDEHVACSTTKRRLTSEDVRRERNGNAGRLTEHAFTPRTIWRKFI